jgi:hypothetical protein
MDMLNLYRKKGNNYEKPITRCSTYVFGLKLC